MYTKNFIASLKRSMYYDAMLVFGVFGWVGSGILFAFGKASHGVSTPSWVSDVGWANAFLFCGDILILVFEIVTHEWEKRYTWDAKDE